jgi:ketosteroid isomerase-like protein
MGRLSHEPQRFIDAGNHVVVIMEIRGKGKDSGIEVTMRSGDVWTVEGGKVVQLAGYSVASEALEAVGLPE